MYCQYWRLGDKLFRYMLMFFSLIRVVFFWNCFVKLWHAFYITAKEKGRRKHWAKRRTDRKQHGYRARKKKTLVRTERYYGLDLLGTGYLNLQVFLKKPDLLLAAVETLTHHVSMQIIMFVKQKDYWWLHWFILKTCYYLFSCFFYCVYCFMLLCDVMWWNFICP